MALKSLKKTLMYSSEDTRDLIEAMVQDQSLYLKINPSTIMEKYILDGLLTENTDLSFWIQSIYRSGWSSGKVISAIFEYNSSGVNWKTRGLDLLPIIDFAIREQDYMKQCKVEEKEMYYVFAQLKLIIQKFEQLKDECLDIESKAKYQEAINYTNHLIEKSENKYDSIPFIDYYRLVKLYWFELKDWTIPFRMLCVISDLQSGWRNTFDTRCELIILLKNLAKSWPEE